MYFIVVPCRIVYLPETFSISAGAALFPIQMCHPTPGPIFTDWQLVPLGVTSEEREKLLIN